MLLPRHVWEAAGGFDERYWIYLEDADLRWRLRREGWSTVWEPTATITQQRGRSSRSRPVRSIMAHPPRCGTGLLAPTRLAPTDDRLGRGMEDRLGALGLVLNAVVLWNSTYLNTAVEQLRAGYPVSDADAARLSPLIDAHLNVHGAYTFVLPQLTGLRPLREPTSGAPDDGHR